MNICNHKKMSGSLVIEAAIGIMVLSMASVFAVNCYIENCRSIKERILNEDVMRSITNLENEIKYNLNKNELEELFKDNEIYLKYDKNFGRNLLEKSIDELERGNDIVIKIVSKNEENIEFRVDTNIDLGGMEINIVDEFNKSWWMYNEEI